MIEIAPDGSEVRIDLPQGGSVSVDGLDESMQVVRGEQRALFLDTEEAETLGKMIDYILDKVRVKPDSESALRAVRPRIDLLLQG